MPGPALGCAKWGWVGVVLLGGWLSGCGLFTPVTDGGSADLLAPAVDASVSGDLAEPSDLMTLYVGTSWQLLTADLLAGVNNGFAINCDDPTLKASELLFTVTNAAGKSAMTMAPCPAGAMAGEVNAAVPDATGPWTVSAAIVDKPLSSSERVKMVAPAQEVTVRIYAFGCDAPDCM